MKNELKCKDCPYCWWEEGDWSDYPTCHWTVKAPGDKAPCEYDEYDLGYMDDYEDEC